MKFFFVELKYLVPTEQLDQYVSAHRAHLQVGYDQGSLLISGPKVPRTGAVLIGKANSLEELQQFFQQDPYQINHLAEYSFAEFLPVKYHALLTDWVKD